MSKWYLLLPITAMLFCFPVQAIHAQSMFGIGGTSNTASPDSGPVLSPESFKSRVQQIHQDTQNNLIQQQRPLPSSSPGSGSNAIQALPPMNPGEQPMENEPEGASTSPSYSGGSSGGSYNSSPSSTQAPASQPYTGYMGGTPANNGNNNTSKPSTGWGVKY